MAAILVQIALPIPLEPPVTSAHFIVNSAPSKSPPEGETFDLLIILIYFQQLQFKSPPYRGGLRGAILPKKF